MLEISAVVDMKGVCIQNITDYIYYERGICPQNLKYKTNTHQLKTSCDSWVAIIN